MNVEYDAFVSYSHESDREFAPALKAGVEKLAKPWNRLRALRLFLDTASLSADPALWNSIEQALERSSWFVLITSTSAARSHWVERELAWWLEHRSVDRLLLVVSDGELAWAGDGFDTERSTALPPILRTAFPQEPRWVDSRETDAIAEVAATLRGIPKDELVGEAVRQHRRTMRVARTAIAALATLLALAVVAAIVALGQRNSAREQARIATARQVASVSTRELTSNLDVALLLAVRAYRTDPSPQTRSALLQAATASPALVRYLPAGAQVSAVAGSGDRRTVVAGLQDGRVQRWDLSGGERRTVLDLAGPPTRVTVSRDGRVVAATDGEQTALWRSGRAPLTFPAAGVGISPSGRTAILWEPGEFPDAGSLIVLDVPSGRQRATHPALLGDAGTANLPVPASDRESLLFDAAYGYWERRRIADWAREAGGRVPFGTAQAIGTPSADGGSFSASNGLSSIPVWRTVGQTDIDHPPLTAEAPIGSARPPTLSPDGSKLAIADGGVVYVARVASPGEPREPPAQLTGPGGVNSGAVAFFGDGEHLVSASGDKVVLWDLGRLDRLAQTRRTAVGSGCNACDGPALAVSPDGRQAMILGSFGGGVIQSLRKDGRAVRLPTGANGRPVWAADGRVALPLDVSEVPADLPPQVHVWSASDADSGIVKTGLTGDGQGVIVVSGRGRVDIRDFATGALRSSMRRTIKLANGQRARVGRRDPHGARSCGDHLQRCRHDRRRGRAPRRRPYRRARRYER